MASHIIVWYNQYIKSKFVRRPLGFRKIGEEKVSFYKDENGNDIYFDGGRFALILDSIWIKEKEGNYTKNTQH